MFVSVDAQNGTIGGGRLELLAAEAARALLRDGARNQRLDLPLGPELGQCCGGRVTLSLRVLNDAEKADAVAARQRLRDRQPHVYILGAGHVGRALADCLALLPLHIVVVDERAAELAQCHADVRLHHTPLPDAAVRAAPAGSAFVILTHDHGLDFALAAEALTRGDAAYVGMIGSATKLATFRAYCARVHPDLDIGALVCPIGANASSDKRPEVIAAFVAAEIMAQFGSVASGSAV